MSKRYPKRLEFRLTKEVIQESIAADKERNKAENRFEDQESVCPNVGHCVLAHAAGLALMGDMGRKTVPAIDHDEYGFITGPGSLAIRYDAAGDYQMELVRSITSLFDDGNYKALRKFAGVALVYEKQ
jgi:hypothetical protein